VEEHGDDWRTLPYLDIPGAHLLHVGTAPDFPLAPEWDETGIMPFELYMDAMTRVTVNLCPLRDTSFNRAKSWLTPLVCAALGIPVIRPPMPEYDMLGVGLVASNRRRWLKLTRIALDAAGPGWSRRLRKVAARHTFERCGWQWREAWEWAALDRKATMESNELARGSP